MREENQLGRIEFLALNLCLEKRSLCLVSNDHVRSLRRHFIPEAFRVFLEAYTRTCARTNGKIVRVGFLSNPTILIRLQFRDLEVSAIRPLLVEQIIEFVVISQLGVLGARRPPSVPRS